MTVIDDIEAVRYGRLGNDFTVCNEASDCRHIDHCNGNQMLTWKQCRQESLNDADFMLRRVQHGFYDDNRTLIEFEANRMMKGSAITADNADNSLRCINALQSIFNETREGYGMMLGISSDYYDYLEANGIAGHAPKLIRRNDNYFSLSSAREYSHWMNINIGDAISVMQESGEQCWHNAYNSHPVSFHSLYAEKDSYGIIRRLSITDEVLDTETIDTERLQYEVGRTNEIIRAITKLSVLLYDSDDTLSALCLQMHNFLPSIRIGAIRPVNVHNVVNGNIRLFSDDMSMNMMLTILTR